MRFFHVLYHSKVASGEKRTCIQRWFGKIEADSVRAGMLGLTVTAIGGGVLSLPYVCRLCGFGLGIAMLFASYGAALWSFGLIIAADKATGPHRSIKNFCLACGGKKLLKLYELIVIFYLYEIGRAHV